MDGGITVCVSDLWVLGVKDGPINSERYLSWADAFFVVYSIDSMESFKGCRPYLQTLALHNKTFRPQTPIILLGNKLDLDRYRLVSVCVCMEINTATNVGHCVSFRLQMQVQKVQRRSRLLS